MRESRKLNGNWSYRVVRKDCGSSGYRVKGLCAPEFEDSGPPNGKKYHDAKTC